jgi:nickel/cobalt exporter
MSTSHIVVVLVLLCAFAQHGLALRPSLAGSLHLGAHTHGKLQSRGQSLNRGSSRSTSVSEGGRLLAVPSGSVACSATTTATSTATATATAGGRVLRGLALALASLVDPAISGGLLSGGLHAITGPDHLAALMAPSVGRSGFTGLRIGALWGVGHGISACILGLSAYFLKGQFTGKFAILEKLAHLSESVVGVSILFIGLVGIKESREAEDVEGTESTSTIDGKVVVTKTVTNKPKSYSAILANGVLHGLSWDGAPSLAPAIAMSSWRGAVTFLLSYSLGTIVTMAIAAGTLGELSMRVGKAANSPDLPRKLSLVSSLLAVTIGVYLILKSVFMR